MACSDCGCQTALRSAARCFACHAAFRRNKSASTARDRFFQKVAMGSPNECWVWTGTAPNGYGQMSLSSNTGNSSPVLVHRFSYEIHVRPLNEGEVIDHLCRNTRCVNPDHLEAVSMAENTRRGLLHDVLRKKSVAILFCKRGHKYVWVGGKKQSCADCQRAMADKWRAQHRGRVNALQQIRRAAQKAPT